MRGLQRLQNFRLDHFQDIKVERVAKFTKILRLYRFLDIKVSRVAKFQTLSFSGYQSCKGCKICKISDFIVFCMSRFRGLQRLQDFRLYHSQDIKVGRVA